MTSNMKINGNYGPLMVVVLLLCLANNVLSRQISVLTSPNQAGDYVVKVIGTVPESSFQEQPAVETTGVTQLQTSTTQQQSQEQPQSDQVAEAVHVLATPGQVPQQGPCNKGNEVKQGDSTLCIVTGNAASVPATTQGSQNTAAVDTSMEREGQSTAADESKEEVRIEPLPTVKNDGPVAAAETVAEVQQKEEIKTEKQEVQKEEKPATETTEQSSKVDQKEATEIVDPKTSTVVDKLLSKVSGREVCDSPHCKKVAQDIMSSINASVDPCDNFYEYACGNWVKEHKIPKFHTQYSRISSLSENNEKVLMDSLKKDQPTDNDTIKKIKLFYRSCMDVEAIEKAGSEPLKQYIEKLGNWNFDTKWQSKKWNFYKTLKRMHREYPAEVLFTVDVHTDPTKPHDKAEFIPLIDQATLNLPQIIYFTSPKIIRLVSSYMSHIIGLSGCPAKTAEEKVRDIMKFETKLATISVPKIAKKYVRIPLSKLTNAVPEFPWLDHLSSVFWTKNVTNDTNVIVLANDYLPNLFELIRKTDKSTLSNYMVWRSIKDSVPLLSKNFRKEHFWLKKKLLGVKHEKPRERRCFGYANNLLGPLMGALFVKNAFSPESKHKVETMMQGIIKAFKDNIEHVDWVDTDTVTAVEEKADKAVYQVGYPDYLYDDERINKRYQRLNITGTCWFDNVLETDKFASLQTFEKLNTISDKHQWITVPHLVNAFYVITKNEIVIPSGILQPPFFFPDEIPRSLSYGAIGHVLGHELTHGFDTTGRKYDLNGEEIDPSTHKVHTWSNSSIKAFEKRAKCLVEQFSKYKVLGKFHLDGFKTLGENIADGGGVKLAYHAFREFLSTHSDEKILPGLNMPHEQLFFLGYAQKECVRTTPAAEFLAVMEDVHPPSKYRVIGTLSNLDAFAKVYKCKPGAPMNPEKKCEVW